MWKNNTRAEEKLEIQRQTAPLSKQLENQEANSTSLSGIYTEYWDTVGTSKLLMS